MPQDETARRLLYGRRRGHRLSPHQQRLFDELLPRLAIDPAEVAAHGDVVLEIGFGGGEHLAYRAVARPATLHLGCEPFENGVASLLARIDAEGISNNRLHCGDARETLAMLPDAALRRIDILYPDP
ncbi:MAG: tRNA (guanosine(46)-N(7))-methyltransferase TrmB, partial [Flavobacteriaceae bacterium]